MIKNAAKLIFVCLAVAAAVVVVGLAAYMVSIDVRIKAGAGGAGVNNAALYLSLDVTAPRGGENGISPLVLDYTVDTAALSACGVEGSAVLKVNISVSRSAAEDVAAEDVYNALSSAVCTASYSSGDSSTALSAQSHVSGGGADAVLVLSVPFSPPVGGECGIRLSVAFASSPLFERERSGLFTLSSVIVAA